MTSSAALPPIRSDESGRWLLAVSALEQALYGPDDAFHARLDELRHSAQESPRGTGRMLNAARELEALAQEPGVAPQRLYALLFAAGKLLCDAGRLREATHRFRAALKHAEAADDVKRCFAATSEMGVTFGRMNRPHDALICLEQASELAARMGDSVKLAHSLVNLAAAQALAGTPDIAMGTAERAEAIARETGDSKALLGALQCRALGLTGKGELDLAAETLADIIATASDLGALPPLAIACGNLACLRVKEARFSEAAELYRQARETFARLNQPDDVARTDLNLGITFIELGDLAAAELHLSAARTAFEVQQNHPELTAVHCNLALLALENAAPDAALQYINTAEQKLGERAVPELQALLHTTRAEVHSASGDEVLALAANQLAAEVSRRADLRQEYVTAELGCAESHLRMHDPAEALRCIEAALQAPWCLVATLRPECVEALTLRARALLMCGRADEARESAAEALELAEDLPMLNQTTGRRVRKLAGELRLLRDALGI